MQASFYTDETFVLHAHPEIPHKEGLGKRERRKGMAAVGIHVRTLGIGLVLFPAAKDVQPVLKSFSGQPPKSDGHVCYDSRNAALMNSPITSPEMRHLFTRAHAGCTA